MKRLWIPILTLLLLFGLSLGHAWYLKQFTTHLGTLLESAETQATQGNWDQASQLTEEAYTLWLDHGFYLHTTLHHSDVDQIYIGFHQVGEYLETQEQGEYSAANGSLVAELDLLYEMEQFTLQNLF